MISPNNLLFVGDIAFDQYPDRKLFGGCSLNAATRAAFFLNQIGSKKKVFLAGPLGDDTAELEGYIKRFNIEFIPFKRKGIAPVQHIKILKDGKKDFWKYEAGVLENFKLNNEEEDFIHCFDGDIIMPCYQQAFSLNISILKSDHRKNLILDFFDLKDFHYDVNGLIPYLQRSKLFCAGLENSTEKLISDFEKLNVYKLITLAERGAKLILDREYQVAAHLVDKVVDSTGAGDTFIATFLASIMIGLDYDQSLSNASIYAAKTVQQIGCQISRP